MSFPSFQRKLCFYGRALNAHQNTALLAQRKSHLLLILWQDRVAERNFELLSAASAGKLF